METKETIIFEVDVTSYEKSLALLSNSINALKADQKAYLEDSKKGIAGAAEAYEKVTVQLKNQQQAYRTTQAALQGYVAGQKSGVDLTNLSNNSIQQNRDLLKQLTAQYINTKNPSEAFTKQIKSVSDALKQQEGAIGDTRRNVGNYAEGFKGALSAITSTIPALGGFKTAQLGVNAAMDANPIGAVILLLQGLVDIFKNNAEVADQVSFAFAAVNKAVGSIIDTVVNTVSSLDNLTQALAHPIDFIFNLGKNMAKAAKEGYEAAKALDAFELSAGRIDRAIQKNQVSIDALTKSLKDRTKTEKERIAIANQIADTEIKNADLIIQKNQELLNAENLRLKGKTLNATEQNKLEQLIADVQNAELEKQIVNAQRQTRINILLDKQNTASVKDNSDERAKARQEELRKWKESQDILNELLELSAKGQQEQYDRYIENFNLNQAALKQLEENATMQIDLQEKTRQTQEEIDAEFAASNYATFKEFYDAKAKLYKDDQANLLNAEKAKVQYQKASLQAASSISENIIKLVSDVAEAQGAGAEFAKALAFVQILTQQAIAIATAVAGGTESGASTGPAAIVSIPAFIATLVGAVTAVIGGAFSLLATPTPKAKFALGGEAIDVGGKSHAQGGTKYYGEDGNSFEVERGEKMFVMKADASRDIAKLSSWNQKYGGNSWTGSPVRYAAAGGVIGNAGFDTRQVSTSALQRAEMTLAIKEAMLSAPAPVVSVKEFNRVNSGVQRSVRVSEV